MQPSEKRFLVFVFNSVGSQEDILLKMNFPPCKAMVLMLENEAISFLPDVPCCTNCYLHEAWPGI